MDSTPSDQAAAFISRWSNSGAAERANYQLFLSELCDLIGVPRPDPTKPNDAAIETLVTVYGISREKAEAIVPPQGKRETITKEDHE